MSDVVVVMEHRRGELRPVSLELVTAARPLADQLGGALIAVLAGAGAPVEEIRADGVDELLVLDDGESHFNPDTVALALDGVLGERRPRLVVLGHTVDAMGVAPALAARHGAAFASDVLALSLADGVLRATREAHGGRLHAELELGGTCAVVTLRPGTHAPAAPAASAPPARVVPVARDPERVRCEHLGYVEPAGGDVDIAAADFLLAVGRGIGDEEELERFGRLAERMGATLAVSRPLVDAGWAAAERQVGQSGRTVKPRVYLAMGISGAVQHLAGMRDAGMVIAVNQDADAPIFSVARHGAVADLFDVADALEARYG